MIRWKVQLQIVCTSKMVSKHSALVTGERGEEKQKYQVAF
jgi:hypothetical protein